MKTSRLSQAVLLSVAALSAKAALNLNTAAASEPVAPTNAQFGETAWNINFEFIRETVRSLQDRLATDLNYRDRFTANPREVLAELGLPQDVQRQILIEEGAGAETMLPAELACGFTCVCTGCCKTS